MENEYTGCLYGCANCGGDNFVIDWERGSSVCSACGCVFEAALRVGGEGYRATHKSNCGALGYESVLAGAYTESIGDFLAAERATYRNHQSPPYRRETYWAERISQWREQEPEIDKADVQIIEDEYWQLTNPWITSRDRMHPPFRELEWRWTDDLRDRYLCHAGTNLRYVVTKDDCRVILWSIDKKRVALGGKPLFVKVSFLFIVNIQHARRSQAADTFFCTNTKLSTPIVITSLPN